MVQLSVLRQRRRRKKSYLSYLDKKHSKSFVKSRAVRYANSRSAPRKEGETFFVQTRLLWVFLRRKNLRNLWPEWRHRAWTTQVRCCRVTTEVINTCGRLLKVTLWLQLNNVQHKRNKAAKALLPRHKNLHCVHCWPNNRVGVKKSEES